MWIKREEVVTSYELVSNFMKLKLSLTALEINGSTRTTFRRRDGHLRKLYISRIFWRSLEICPTIVYWFEMFETFRQLVGHRSCVWSVLKTR